MEIEFWENAPGRSPVTEFIGNLSVKTQSKIAKKLEVVEQADRENLFKSRIIVPLKGYKLYEIRFRIQSVNFRFLCDIHGDLCSIYHAFKKKRPDTPPKEIDIALQRQRLHLSKS